MELRDIVELVNLVASRDIGELELERDGSRLRIVKGTPHAPAAAAGLAAPVAPVVERIAAPAAIAPAAAPPADDPDLYVMRSPIVGTFYRAASPSSEPYVKIGDRVKKAQVVCIVEAMKLMNEIESEAAGVVVDVLVEDGQPIEYGEPLFKIRPDK